MANVRLYDYCNWSTDAKKVIIGNIHLYFSYETVIAFSAPETGTLVSENCWSTTTGKHLNVIDGGDKKSRLSRDEFEEKLNEILSKSKVGVM